MVIARMSTTVIGNAGAGHCLAPDFHRNTSKIPLPKFYSLNKIFAVGF